ncbi:MAG: arsenate reductase, glutathione/glutaredoxin type [Synechococcales cyanobacterium CRU_2_2]|nr:arsenate reductase, glutathione/glutaredoxin type [Synechococcales cyanobacterium CRU_2_2]
MTEATKRIMFICRKNSARSQMAEGFAKQLGAGWLQAGQIRIYSSGLEASSVTPEAIAAMEAIGIDIREQTSDALADFEAEDFDVVISLCGPGIGPPQAWLQREVFEAWQLDDPVENPEIFPRVRDEIRGRVKTLLLSLKQHEYAESRDR